MLKYNLPKLTSDELARIAAYSNNLIRFQTLSWNKFKRWCSTSGLSAPPTPELGPELDHLTDTELLERMPVRSKLDSSIRRLKWRDVWSTTPADLRHEMRYYQHLDLIFSTNVMIWGRLFGVDCLRDLRLLGLFNGLDHFLDRASKISAYVKRFPYDPDDVKQKLAELSGLIGYLTTDTESWNTAEELAALAEGGNQHGLVTDDWRSLFPQLAELIKNGRSAPKFITFEEYVKSGQWTTSGSASIGKVVWTHDLEHGSFKAKKNMLFEIYTPDELWALAEAWDGTLRSRAFIKSEAGKRRLAVSSNLESYLYESYILRLYGHSFKNWDYITLDESAATQHNRSAKTVQLLKAGAWALPFDFARFDHQPTTWEIQTMVSSIIREVSVPTTYAEQFSNIASKVVSSYAKSHISMVIDGEEHGHTVTGGIPSGVRITSLIGNQWNSIMTSRARALATAVLGYDPVLFGQIKGDDTAIFCRTAVECWVFRMSYQAINAIGLDSKFGISQNVCEFLRNEASPSGLRGWANRTIPTLTQRKPWTAQPWSPSRDTATLASNIRTLERRLGIDLAWAHRANSIKWSRLMRQSYFWLHLPVRLGGLGVYPFNGWVPSRKLPLVTKPIIDTDVRAAVETDGPQWLALPISARDKYLKLSMSEKMAFDDIPGPQQAFFRDYIDEVRSLKITWSRDNQLLKRYNAFKIVAEQTPILTPSLEPDNSWPKLQTPNLLSSDSSVPPFPQWVREYMSLKRLWEPQFGTLPKFIDLASKFFPNISDRIQYYERNGWHRADAIDLASGSVPAEANANMHPMLTDYLRTGLLRAGILRWKSRVRIALKLSAYSAIYATKIQMSTGGALYKY